MADSGTDALLVLSYNVCWEAMSHHHGLPLGDACTFVPGNPHLTRCAVKVAHCIDAMPEAMGMDGFAFIGLQEASLWWEWRDLAPCSLAQGDRAGDYVFDSAGPAADRIPPNYPPDKLQSDHLPVVALLPAA